MGVRRRLRTDELLESALRRDDIPDMDPGVGFALPAGADGFGAHEKPERPSYFSRSSLTLCR